MEVLQADGAVKYVLHYAEKVCTVIQNEWSHSEIQLPYFLE